MILRQKETGYELEGDYTEATLNGQPGWLWHHPEPPYVFYPTSHYELAGHWVTIEVYVEKNLEMKTVLGDVYPKKSTPLSTVELQWRPKL